MNPTDPVVNQLAERWRHCRCPSRQRRIHTRWRRYPALAGRTVDDVVALLEHHRDHPDHNRVCADLLRAHHDGDPDATTVLLVAVRPLLLALVRPGHGPEQLPHLWAAAAKQLATTDPDLVETNAKPFFVTLLGRLRRDAWRLRHAQTRGYVPIGADHCSVVNHLDATAAAHHSVEDVAIARLSLAELGAQRRHGSIDPAQWEELLHLSHLQPERQPAVGSAHRNRVMRLRRRLAAATGYAA